PGGRTMPGTETTSHAPPGGSKTAAISNLTVRLLSEYTGRGPTRARTFLNDDMVTVVLQDTLTKAERTLVDTDHNELVMRTRSSFQEIMGDELIVGIQKTLGRKVIAFLSANHIDPDIAVETFILAPSEVEGLDLSRVSDGAGLTPIKEPTPAG
ncbi:MAG: DUF2294 domain-containing protein, partial [Solirubrobacteraceae bacterium]